MKGHAPVLRIRIEDRYRRLHVWKAMFEPSFAELIGPVRHRRESVRVQ